VRFHETGINPWEKWKKLNEIGEEDEELLIAELAYADVVVTGQSTIAVDAAVFDKPTVIVYFDQEEREYWESIRRYYDYEYYVPITQSGGVQLAHCPEELVAQVRRYLTNPEYEHEGRQQIAREQAYLLDGRATERLTELLYKHLTCNI
jgi:CDP-glycerol glycerophosphotransferase (TagB/SpsB family)